ncbi:MAG TPA: gluconate:H+ symporter [Terracidiphilus sp.]|nr:gluconate:H+ symporter [Terracidiphilus sp.]
MHSSPSSFYLLACAAGTVVLLLVLIARLRLHPALALAAAAFTLGIAARMPLTQVPASFAAGVGNLMGHIAIVLGMGAILGQLLARSGGATALGNALVEGCGPQGLPWALLGLGILVGMPVFFEVGLVLMMPIIAAAARRSKRPAILVGLPMLAGLSIVHGTIPPHPAAMLAATQYHADLGRTIVWGVLVGIPAGIMAGPVLQWVLTRFWKGARQRPAPDPEHALFEAAGDDGAASGATDRGASAQPAPPAVGPARALCAILLPIALIFLGSWADTLAAPGSTLNRILHFIGSPDVALLTAVLVALATLGTRVQTGRHHGRELQRQVTTESFAPIANVLIILAAAGGLSGILRDSGAAQATISLALGAHMPPLVLAWLLAAVVRVSMGSATVAMAVASGVLAPMVGHVGVRPELLVLATGTGSLVFSQVNDPGFWMVQTFFNLEMKETFATWTALETVLSVTGLIGTLALSALLR